MYDLDSVSSNVRAIKSKFRWVENTDHNGKTTAVKTSVGQSYGKRPLEKSEMRGH
jgi:hypothetical protein